MTNDGSDEKNIEQCLWHSTGECDKQFQKYLKGENCNGYKVCFAYIGKSYINQFKKTTKTDYKQLEFDLDYTNFIEKEEKEYNGKSEK